MSSISNEFRLTASGSIPMTFYANSAERLRIETSGAVHTGISTFQDIDVDGHTNLDNVSIAGVTTTTDHIDIDADDKRLRIGDSQDIQIFHNTVAGGTRFANSSYIENNTGNLFIRGIVGTIIGSTSGEIYAQFLKDD